MWAARIQQLAKYMKDLQLLPMVLNGLIHIRKRIYFPQRLIGLRKSSVHSKQYSVKDILDGRKKLLVVFRVGII